ncbi:hypothetical protein BDW74DRAFT_175155 [Aspergillus multicolor]|uniref:uncharacterized protein n=1 Tax=Aspergillus multicolor TaxID=41759 RepID=UPI003CCE4D5A
MNLSDPPNPCLTHLPAELLNMIAENLPFNDLKSFRQANRFLNNATYHHFTRTYFSNLTTDLSRASLEALDTISQDTHLSACVQQITITKQNANCMETCYGTGLAWRRQKMKGLQSFHNDALIRPQESIANWKTVLSRFSNCVLIRVWKERNAYEWDSDASKEEDKAYIALRKTISWPGPRVPGQIFDDKLNFTDVLVVVMEILPQLSLASRPRPLAINTFELDFMSIHPEPADMTHLDDPKVLSFASNLRHLSITGGHRRFEGKQQARYLHNLIRHTEANLETLRLECATGGEILHYLARDPQPVGSSDPSEQEYRDPGLTFDRWQIPHDLPHFRAAKLRALSISGFQLREGAEVRAFIVRHGATLERLTISDALVYRGGIRRFLVALRSAGLVKLRYLRLADLREGQLAPWLPRWPQLYRRPRNVSFPALPVGEIVGRDGRRFEHEYLQQQEEDSDFVNLTSRVEIEGGQPGISAWVSRLEGAVVLL